MRQFLVCLLLVAFVCAQTPQPAPPVAAPNGAQASPAAGEKPAETPAPESKVGPEDAVITVKGYCADSALEGDACKTAVSRAQFEKLSETLQPGMSPAMRRQLATAYARMLAMSSAAEKRGLDKQPHFDEAMHFARMQILSQELSKALQAEAAKVSDEDIQDYYQKNGPNFEQATFIRIFIPRTKRVVTPPAPPRKPGTKTGATAAAAKPAAKAPAKEVSPEEQQKAGEEAMKKEAKLLHARAVKGEDPDKLQKDAFVAAGLLGNPPPTKMEKVRRPSLPANQQSVMDLKPGEVSEVISDASGNYIYKMVSKQAMPLDSVKTEIRNQLSSQRFRDAMQRFQNNAELNDAYFGPTRNPAMPLPPRGAKPPVQQGEDDPD